MKAWLQAGIGVLLLVGAFSGCGTKGQEQADSSYDAARSYSLRETGDASRAKLPIRWRIGEIDPRFGLSEAQVRNAVERAAALWEAAAERELIVHDSSRGIAINLVYDDRQERRLERRRAKAELDARSARLEAAKERIRSAGAEVDEAHARLEQAVAALNAATRQHNERVREWNLRGGAPPEVIQEIEADRENLERMAERIRRDEMAFRALEDRASRLAEEHNALVEEYNALVVEYNQRFGEGWQEEAGRYESMGGSSGFESITVFVVENEDHLALILAHELGHALGIDHVEHDPAALMSPYTQHGGGEVYELRLTESDIAALREALARH